MKLNLEGKQQNEPKDHVKKPIEKHNYFKPIFNKNTKNNNDNIEEEEEEEGDQQDNEDDDKEVETIHQQG
jgi:hypothetical protein